LEERKLSVAAVVTKAKTFEEATQKYGVPRTIIQDTRSQLSKLFGIESTTAGNQQLRCIAQNSPTEFNQKLNQLSVSQRGPKPYVPNIELQIFASMVDMQDQAGYGDRYENAPLI
jgi:hypothetical protein